MQQQLETYAGRKKIDSIGGGNVLGTMGLSISTGDGARSCLPGLNAPRVPSAAITAAGGTLPKLIEGLLEAVRAVATVTRARVELSDDTCARTHIPKTNTFPGRARRS